MITGQTGRCSRRTSLAICLGIATALFCAGVKSAQARGEKNSGEAAKTVAVAGNPSAALRGRHLLAEQRAMVNALAGKRDPFRVPPPPRLGGGSESDGPLPPGSRGLVIGRIRLKGIVREDANGAMIAVVTNPLGLAYFLHVHDRVYNGVVTRITTDSIDFSMDRLDQSGQVEAREIVLKLGSARQEVR